MPLGSSCSQHLAQFVASRLSDLSKSFTSLARGKSEQMNHPVNSRARWMLWSHKRMNKTSHLSRVVNCAPFSTVLTSRGRIRSLMRMRLSNKPTACLSFSKTWKISILARTLSQNSRKILLQALPKDSLRAKRNSSLHIRLKIWILRENRLTTLRAVVRHPNKFTPSSAA